MQQTEKYALNLIETSDPFSPAALNENAQKTEAAIMAEAAARAAGDTALGQRVTVLEGRKAISGSYAGSNSTRTFELGATPVAVFVKNVNLGVTYLGFAVTGSPSEMGGEAVLEIIPGGFKVRGTDLNLTNHNFVYVAIL